MNKLTTCILLAILVLLSFGLGQANHPIITDVTKPNVLLVSSHAEDNTVSPASENGIVHHS